MPAIFAAVNARFETGNMAGQGTLVRCGALWGLHILVRRCHPLAVHPTSSMLPWKSESKEKAVLLH
eukprot:1161282-Pelagomonas_calceolata.AAC.21